MKLIFLINAVFVGLVLPSLTFPDNQSMTIEKVLNKDKEVNVGLVSHFILNGKSLERDSTNAFILPLKFNSTDTVALMSFVFKKKTYEVKISPRILKLGNRYKVTIRFFNKKEGYIYIRGTTSAELGIHFKRREQID